MLVDFELCREDPVLMPSVAEANLTSCRPLDRRAEHWGTLVPPDISGLGIGNMLQSRLSVLFLETEYFRKAADSMSNRPDGAHTPVSAAARPLP
jgi:hypothetical protein